MVRTRSRARTFLGISAVVAVLIALHAAGALSFVDTGIRAVFDSRMQALQRLRAGEDSAGGEGTSLRSKEAEIALLLEENKELRAQLGFLSQKPYRHVGADVIGKTLDPVGNVVMIDRGEGDGIRPGNPVVAGDGIIVGKVVRAEDRRAHVALLHDPESRLAATVVSADKSIGLVEGGFGVSVRMNYIPQNERVNIGDMVVTSGLEPGIPRGLLIGTVAAVEKEAYQPFQRAVITPERALDKITVVSVIVQAEE